MKANIFNIQKACTQNGPGFRTVIHFQGCSLRCSWCSGTTASEKPVAILWDRKKCFYGHLCEIHCPTNSISFDHDTLIFTNDNCTGCRSCIQQCPTKALEFADKLMEIDEVMSLILKDSEALKQNGGVTLAGGEILDQPEFAMELLSKCREAGIPTAVETSGFASSLTFSRMAQKTDLILFHLKHYDNKEHIKYTGVSQGKILENLDTAVAVKAPVIVRIPVVPGVNASPLDAKKFTELLLSHHITEVELLPFRLNSDKKYKAFPIDEADFDINESLNLREYASILERGGLKVTVI